VTVKKAIIVAAGMGRRLAPYTDSMPKCLVPIAGKPMIVRAIEAFRAAGVEDVVVIRGYKADVLEARRGELGDVRFVENDEFRSNNILQSLFKARHELDSSFYVTYGDIVFGREVVTSLRDAPGDVSLIIDRDFATVYEGRTEHPLSEAEVAAVDGTSGLVTHVGKRSCPVERAWGEFIGLAKITVRGARAMTDAHAKLAAAGGPPFPRNTWANAYLTDLFEHLIAGGFPVTPVPIRGRWREIDTVQDLQRAEQAVDY
jgi:NDP-sugar pyrophosphorylase family protein